MKFSFTGKEDLIPNLQAATDSFCEQNGIEFAVAMKLQLIVEELAMNVIHHGSDGRDCNVELELEWNQPDLLLLFRDNGKKFDPLTVPPPDLDATLEDRPVGGLGLFLVKKMSSELRYNFADGFNQLKLRINCSPENK